MRFITTLTLALVITLSLLTVSSHAKNYFPLTPSQKHFTAIIVQLKTFRSVEWESPVSMWVRIPSSQKSRAQELANTMKIEQGTLSSRLSAYTYTLKKASP